MAGTQNNQALVERLLDDLGKLMWTMVWDVANSDRWMLDPEEVHAELCLELVKLVNKYHQLPYTELKATCVTSMRNRVHDLASMCYLTHRKAERLVYSLDGSTEDDPQRTDVTLDGTRMKPFERNDRYAPSVDNEWFDIDDFCEGMSADAKELIREILWPSERTAYFLWLTAQRKQQVYKKGLWTLTITPLIMTRSLGWPSERLKIAWDEISTVLKRRADFNSGLVE